MSLKWLPDPIALSDYEGDWSLYEDALYEVFLNDLVRNPVRYNGQRLGTKKHPEIAGKSATFWHIVSEGYVEDEKIPDISRCERLCWVRPIIENSHQPNVLKWQTTRNGETRTLLWLKEKDYIVVIAHRNGYSLIWTAYVTDKQHRQRKLQAEHDRYHAQNSTP